MIGWYGSSLIAGGGKGRGRSHERPGNGILWADKRR
jgi:hypothetical protein